MLSFNSFVSSSKSLNESLNKPVHFEYMDDTDPNKAFYIAFDIGSTKYGASLVETKYNKVYRLSVYRIVNVYRKPWSFKTATHVRPVLSTVIAFLEKTVPYVYSRMDAMILDVTEKSDIAKYQSLFSRIIKMNPQLKKYNVAPVAKTSEKKNDNFMFVVKNGKEAGNIFTSAAFKKNYSFVTNQDGAVNVDILAAVEPKKVEKPIVSLEPSKKFLFDVLEVEYNIADPGIIANLEKTKNEYKSKKENGKSSVGIETDFTKLKKGDEFNLYYGEDDGFTDTVLKIDRKFPGNFADVLIKSTGKIVNYVDLKNFTVNHLFSTVKGYRVTYTVNVPDIQDDFSKLNVGDIFEFTEDGKTISFAMKVTDRYGPYIIATSTDGTIVDKRIDISKIKPTIRYKLVDQGEKKEDPKVGSSNNTKIFEDPKVGSSNNTKIFEDPNTRHDFNDIGVMFASAFLYTISKNPNYHHINQTIPKFDDAYTRYVENRAVFEKEEGLNVMTYNDFIMETSVFNVAIKIEQQWKDFAALLINDKEKRDAFFDLIPSLSLSVLRNAISITRASTSFIAAEKLDLDIEPISEVDAFKTSNFSQPFAGDLGYEEDGPPPESIHEKVEYLTKQDKEMSEWYEKDFDKHMYDDDNLLRDGVRALKDYTGSYAYDMNTEMRKMLANFNGENDVPDSMMGHTHSLMRYFDKAAPKLEKGIWVYRNVGSHPDPESLSVKDDYIDPAFQSTTISSKMSYGSGTMRLKIYLPAGTPCFPLIDSPKTKNPDEYEVLLPALSVLSITKIFKRQRYGEIYYIIECIYTGTAMSSFLNLYEKKTRR